MRPGLCCSRIPGGSGSRPRQGPAGDPGGALYGAARRPICDGAPSCPWKGEEGSGALVLLEVGVAYRPGVGQAPAGQGRPGTPFIPHPRREWIPPAARPRRRSRRGLVRRCAPPHLRWGPVLPLERGGGERRSCSLRSRRCPPSWGGAGRRGCCRRR